MKPNVPEHMPAQQKGYTIVELAIALTIISVLIVAGLAGVSSVLTSSKANAQIEDSGRAMSKLQSILSSSSVSGIDTNSGVGMGLFPSSRVAGTTPNQTVANTFGGSEFLASNNSPVDGAATNTAAIYTITSIPKAVCADIATSLAPLSSSAYVAATNATAALKTVNAAEIVKTSGGVADAAAIGTKCNANALGTVYFFLKP